MLRKKNVVINFVGAFVPIVVIFISVPLYLKVIGVVNYGVLSLVWTAFGYFGIFDFGIARAVTHGISRVNRSDLAHQSTIASSAFVLALAIGTFVSVVATIGVIVARYKLHDPLSQEILKSSPFLLLGIPILLASSTLNGAIEGLEKFGMANSLQVIGSLFYQLTPLVLALCGISHLHWLIDAVVGARVLMFFFYIVACCVIFDWSRFFSISKASALGLLKFGGSVALINVLDPILNRIDQFVLAKMTGLGNVANYSIAMNSVSRLNIIPLALSRTLFPALSARSFDDYKGDLRAMSERLTWIWAGLCALGILCSDLVFRLWLHNAISTSVSQIAKILMVGLFSNCLAYLPYTALQALGRSSRIIRAHLIELPIYLLAMVILIRSFGVQGAAIAWSFRVSLDYVILWKMCSVKATHHWVFGLCLVALCLLAK